MKWPWYVIFIAPPKDLAVATSWIPPINLVCSWVLPPNGLVVPSQLVVVPLTCGSMKPYTEPVCAEDQRRKQASALSGEALIHSMVHKSIVSSCREVFTLSSRPLNHRLNWFLCCTSCRLVRHRLIQWPFSTVHQINWYLCELQSLLVSSRVFLSNLLCHLC